MMHRNSIGCGGTATQSARGYEPGGDCLEIGPEVFHDMALRPGEAQISIVYPIDGRTRDPALLV